MLSSVAAEVDFIEELRLRRWAREHYVPRNQRQMSWHPVVLDEMESRDREGQGRDVNGINHSGNAVDPLKEGRTTRWTEDREMAEVQPVYTSA